MSLFGVGGLTFRYPEDTGDQSHSKRTIASVLQDPNAKIRSDTARFP